MRSEQRTKYITAKIGWLNLMYWKYPVLSAFWLLLKILKPAHLAKLMFCLPREGKMLCPSSDHHLAVFPVVFQAWKKNKYILVRRKRISSLFFSNKRVAPVSLLRNQDQTSSRLQVVQNRMPDHSGLRQVHHLNLQVQHGQKQRKITSYHITWINLFRGKVERNFYFSMTGSCPDDVSETYCPVSWLIWLA
jgi:hypothetical protein